MKMSKMMKSWFSSYGVTLFLNRDAFWPIQGKKHYLKAAIVGGIHPRRKYGNELFLVIMGICESIFKNFLASVCTYGVRNF